MIAYHGSAMTANNASARGSKTVRNHNLRSRRNQQNKNVTVNGMRRATGPFARTPKAIAAKVAYSQLRLRLSKYSQAPNIDAAISMLSNASAVAARPMM